MRKDITAALLCPGRLVLESHSSQADAFSGEKHSAYKRLKTAFAERRASAVVALTKEDSQYWHSARRLEVIPNFSDMARHSNAKTRHGALAIGRSRSQPRRGGHGDVGPEAAHLGIYPAVLAQLEP